jgi:hypothetical protein
MESRFPILAHHSVRGVAVSLWPDIGAVVTDGSGRRGAAAHPLCKQEYAMHRRALPFVMIAVALSAVFVAHASVPDDAEVALDGLSFSSQNANRSWSLETAGRPICSERFEVRSGDVWPHDLQTGNAGTERSELAGPIDATNPGAFDTNVWTAYQFRVQRGARVTSPWVVLGDWHMLPDPGDIGAGSSWQLELDAGDILGFETRTSTEKPIVDGPHMHYIWKSAAPVSRGVWHSLVSRAIFDWRPDGNGAIDVWLDGTQIIRYRGPVGYNTTRPPYFKFGVYRAAAPETLAVYYSNVAVSRTSLLSRVTQAPKICGSD